MFSDNSEGNKILVGGVMRLLEDLELSPDSRLVLILAWKLKAAAQCEFTRDEFVNGLTELGCVCHIGNMGVFISFSFTSIKTLLAMLAISK